MDYIYNADNPLKFEPEELHQYFNEEMKYMANKDYFKSKELIQTSRENALNLIQKHSKCENFDALIPYLAMNYFDRYISRHQQPVPGLKLQECDKEVLLAISCLSAASKLRNSSFSIDDFLLGRNLNLDSSDIRRMEFFINLRLETVSVTPFTFVAYFFNQIPVNQGFGRRTINEIIIQAQGDIDFTQFRPSIIAASALLAASSFLYPKEFSSYIETIRKDEHVNEGDLTACLNLMVDMCKKKNILREPGEGPRLREQAGEPSGSSQPSQPAPNEPAMDKPSESSQPSQPAPNEPPMDEPSGSSSSIPRRECKAPMYATSEIQEEPESKHDLDFELKWVIEKKDLTIDFPHSSMVVSTEQTIDSPLVFEPVKSADEVKKGQEPVDAEEKYMPLNNYVQDPIAIHERLQAIQIFQRFSANNSIGSLSLYMALNYFDRYMSRIREHLDDTNARLLDYVASACLISACRHTKESNFSRPRVIQAGNLHGESLDEVEAAIAVVMGPTMDFFPLTNFINFFLSKIDITNTEKCDLERKTLDSVLYMSQKEIRFCQYRPSTLAAAAILAACAHDYSKEYNTWKQLIVDSKPNIKQELDGCIKEIVIYSTVRLLETVCSSPSVGNIRAPTIEYANGILDTLIADDDRHRQRARGEEQDSTATKKQKN